MSARCSPERAVRDLIQRLRNQAIVARWIGEQAVNIVRRELATAWEAGRTDARPTDGEAPGDPTALHPGDIGDVEAPLTVDLDALFADGPGVPVEDLPAADDAEVLDVEQPDGESASEAPFDGYDTLPASHIVQRLRRMSPEALRGVRAFEAAHRNRRTVLAMVDQLLVTP